MRTKWRACFWRSSLTIISTLVEVAIISNFNPNVWAQIIADETLGAESSVVTPDNIKGMESERISGGAIRGNNLFHSFQKFHIGEGRGAYFNNPGAIENIFSRVTGSNPSEILGTLGVLGDANLFFLNPNGIIFGQNASLDLRGSFVGTTADIIVFPDGKQFSATNPDIPPLLTLKMQQPIGLQFEGKSGIITNAADLAVASRQTLSLSGSDVATTGTLTASGGRVEVLGTNSVVLLEDATIDVSASTGGGTVLIGGDFQGQGTVPNAKRTYVGNNVNINADAITNGNGGKVIVWADEVTGFYGSISARGGIESGNGGLVEVSGKEHLIFRGNVNTITVNGLSGTLLLDPTNIIIADGSGDEAEDGADSFAGNNSGVEGSILSTSLSEINDTAPTTIYESELEGLSGDTNIILQATNDIRVQDLSDDGLELAAGAGVIALSADVDGDGVGDFVMEDNVADTIFTNGRDIGISGASLRIGNIDTSLLTVGDAGELIETALFVSDSPGKALESISGNISDVEDVDLFQIYLTGEKSFSASTVGVSNIFTQLFLFNADGFGIYTNDNQAGCNCFQATLPANHPLTPPEPGIYYLAISGDGVFPASEEGLIFPSRLQTGDFESIDGTTGAAGDLPLSGWVDVFGFDDGSYVINLTGVEGTEVTITESIQPRGDSGSITLEATNGNINVNELNTAAGLGDSGSVLLESSQNIILKSIISQSSSGQAGNIKAITNNTISMRGSLINSRTSGAGNGGDIYIGAEDLNLQKISVITAGTDNIGRGGNITIDVQNLTIEEGSSIATTTNGNTSNAGRGGDLAVNASESLEITGTSGQLLFSSALSTGTFGKGNAGNLTVTTGTLLIKDGGQLLTDTLPDSEGNGGNLTVTASESVQVIGRAISDSIRPSALFAKTEGRGKAGNVTIITPNLLVQDGAEVSTNSGSLGAGGGNLTISASESVQVNGTSTDGKFPSGVLAFTTGKGNAGNINITTEQLLVQNGAIVSTSTQGEGTAGSVIIEASELLQVIGTSADGRFQSSLLSRVSSGAAGNGGNLSINSQNIFLEDNATFSVDNQGSGVAGNIELTANSLTLARGRISAETTSNQGGDITLTLTDKLTLRNNSPITATAGTAEAGGDGGNIEINAPFIIVFPYENSDITANAFRGNGGNIIINTQGIFGLEFRDRQTALSDITASSEFGQQGTVEINTSAIDPTRSLNNLQQDTVEAKVAQSCQEMNSQTTLEFFDIGRGGLPPTPEDLFTSDVIIAEWIPLDLVETNIKLSSNSTKEKITEVTVFNSFSCQK
ncbi:MAG: filamentous hemagglutinin N-terminal domain-containing protein [Xenococcaceae cyanobacterium MO_188.B19]|nr:filamentous hemagglutinin N-terminal domain-containing protein [Xenococcaceae cyanobacterium MO_188.B19]